jgi:hypothetical protein
LRIGEERHRRFRVDDDEVLEAVELHGGELGEVPEAVDGRPAGPALQPGGERLAQQLGAGGVRCAAGGDQGRFPARGPADEQGAGRARAEDVGDRHPLLSNGVRARGLGLPARRRRATTRRRVTGHLLGRADR